MGKKRGNAGVGVDFKRVKHKVGKKLPRAQNDTDVNFKSRSIHLPTQTVQQDKTGLAVNTYNLTLKELLAQSSHYSDKTRKAALQGLQDLLTRHPKELRPNAGEFFAKICERVSDLEGGVRTALRALLREQVLPLLEPTLLQPFMPVIMAHVCGAMTHLSMDVRMDALAFLDVLMEHAPQLVVCCHLGPCLAHFAHLLSQSQRGRSIKAQSVGALLKVLTALSRFLHRAFTASGVQTTVGSATAPTNTPARAQGQGNKATSSKLGPLRNDRTFWPPSSAASVLAQAPLAQPPTNTTASTATAVKGVDTATHVVGDSAHNQAMRLVHLLMDCWSDCNPGQLSQSPELEPTQAMLAALNATDMLLQHILLVGSEAERHALLSRLQEPVLKHVAVHFPATQPVVKPSSALADMLVQYNLQAVQLLSRFLPLAHQTSHAGVTLQEQQADAEYTDGRSVKRQKVQQQPQHSFTDRQWVHVVLQYYLGVLNHGQLVPAAGMLAEQPQQSTDSHAAAYMAVLGRVNAAVKAVDPVAGQQLMEAVAAFGLRQPAKSTLRAECLKLQHQVMQDVLQGHLYLDDGSLASWLPPLPRLLWELQGAEHATYRSALGMLLDAGRFSPPGSAVSCALATLQPQLAPLFCTLLPSKPSKTSDKTTPSTVLLPGPLARLPAHLCQVALDAVYHSGPLDRTLTRALATAAATTLYSDTSARRMVEIIIYCSPISDLALSASTLLTLLISQPTSLRTNDGRDVSAGQERRRLITDTVCTLLHSFCSAATLLQLLQPQLQQLLSPSLDPHCQSPAASTSQDQRYSFIRVCVMAATEPSMTSMSVVHLPSTLACGQPGGLTLQAAEAEQGNAHIDTAASLSHRHATAYATIHGGVAQAMQDSDSGAATFDQPLQRASFTGPHGGSDASSSSIPPQLLQALPMMTAQYAIMEVQASGTASSPQAAAAAALVLDVLHAVPSAIGAFLHHLADACISAEQHISTSTEVRTAAAVASAHAVKMQQVMKMLAAALVLAQHVLRAQRLRPLLMQHQKEVEQAAAALCAHVRGVAERFGLTASVQRDCSSIEETVADLYGVRI